MTSKTLPTLVGHRGYPDRYPENTLISIQAAVEAGAPWFEFDVQLSSDLVPYLCHDDSLKRTAGIDRLIMDMSAKELQGLGVKRMSIGGFLASAASIAFGQAAEQLKRDGMLPATVFG